MPVITIIVRAQDENPAISVLVHVDSASKSPRNSKKVRDTVISGPKSQTQSASTVGPFLRHHKVTSLPAFKLGLSPGLSTSLQ